MFSLCSVRRCKAELKNCKSQNEELRKTLEIMEGQIRARVGPLYSVNYFNHNLISHNKLSLMFSFAGQGER